MQDPVFNSMDEDFLRNLGYTVVPTPEGVENIDDTTFLFAPHLEWPIYVKALQKASPSLCIGNDIREYLESPVESTSPEAKSVFQNFTERYICRAMPDFERSSWCDYISIYMRRPLMEVDETVTP